MAAWAPMGGHSIPDSWLRAVSLLAIVVAWQVGASAADSRLFPGPLTVAQAMYVHATTGDLVGHVGITLYRVAVSFVIAMALGTAVGIVMGRSHRTDVMLHGLLVLGLNIPALVVIILCFIWFGLTEVAAISAVAVNKFPIVVVNLREGTRAINPELLQVAQVFRLGRRRTFFRVYLPQLYPYLMASARSGLALIWKIVLVVELLGRSDGVGFKLAEFFHFFDIVGILSYSFAFIAVVLAIELAVIGPLDRRMREWRP